MKMICPNCKSMIDDGSAFCVRCGFRMGQPMPTAPAGYVPPAPTPVASTGYAPVAPAGYVQPAPVAPAGYVPPAPTAPTGYVPPAPVSDDKSAFVDHTDPSSPAKPQRYEYKLLSQKDRLLSTNVDTAALGQIIDRYAKEGWRVVSFSNIAVGRQEFIILLEREV